MANYGQYCPVAKAAELLGDRWTLLIVRELLYGPIRFGEIERNLPGISKSVLSQRLKRLQRDGIARIDTKGAYEFTDVGQTLRPVVQTLGEWVAAYVLGEPTRAEADPELLMLFVSRHVDVDQIPQRRLVTEWRFRDRSQRIWLTIEKDDVSVCLDDPCLDVDVYVEGDTVDLYRVYVGRTSLRQAILDGSVKLSGTRDAVAGFKRVMLWSSFSPLATRTAEPGPSPATTFKGVRQ